MRNLVAKHAKTYNRSVVIPDKKRDYNRKLKHKKQHQDE